MTQIQQCRFILVLTCASLVEDVAVPDDVAAPSTPTFQVLPAAPPRPQLLKPEPTTLRQRAVPVLSTVFSHEGRKLTTVDGKGQVAEWNLAIPGEQEIRAELNRELACAVLSDDERLVAFADQDGSVSIFELAARRYRLKSATPGARTVALAFSHDGGQLAGVTDAGLVRLWDSRRGDQIRTLPARPGPVQTAIFSHDGKQLAVSSFTGELRLFDLTSSGDPKIVNIGATRVTAASFTPDDRRLVIAGADGTLRVHDLHGLSPPVSLATHVFAVWRLAWDAPGERLAAASWDGTIRLWETASWELLQSHKSHEQSISAMTFGPEGDLISASLDGRLQYWKRAVPGRRATAMIAGRTDSVWVAVYSPDGQTLFVGGRGKRFELWDVATHELLVSREGHPTTRCAVFSPDSRTLITGGDDGIVSLWEAKTGELQAELRRHPGAVSAVVCTSNGETLVSACDGGVVKLWDLKALSEKASWREHNEQIYCANISPDDKWLLTGGGNWTSDARGELFVWELATGRIRARLDGHRLAVWAIVFTTDGRRFATSCSSGEVKLWDLETLTELLNLQHPTWVRGLAMSPDGATLAVGQGDASIRLWDTTDWQQKAALDGHESFAFHLQFAPDGHTLATSSNDGTVRFWSTTPK